MENNIITTACKIMSNVAVVDEINAIRAQVVANRTNSVANGITKAAMIAIAKEKMRNGVCHLEFVKKSGEIRDAYLTTLKNVMDVKCNGRGISRENYATTCGWDVMNSKWVSFRWETLLKVY